MKTGSPFISDLLRVKRCLQFDDLTALLLQSPRILSIVHNQLCQSGKLLSTVQIIEIPRTLDFNVSYIVSSSEGERYIITGIASKLVKILIQYNYGYSE